MCLFLWFMCKIEKFSMSKQYVNELWARWINRLQLLWFIDKLRKLDLSIYWVVTAQRVVSFIEGIYIHIYRGYKVSFALKIGQDYKAFHDIFSLMYCDDEANPSNIAREHKFSKDSSCRPLSFSPHFSPLSLALSSSFNLQHFLLNFFG